MFPRRGDRKDPLGAGLDQKTNAGVIQFDYAGVFCLKAVIGR